MPVISMFYGIVILIYYTDDKRHKKPHIHIRYQDQEAVISIPDGEILEGSIKANRMKLVQAWVEIHKEDLMTDWELAVNGQPVFNIDPLR